MSSAETSCICFIIQFIYINTKYQRSRLKLELEFMKPNDAQGLYSQMLVALA